MEAAELQLAKADADQVAMLEERVIVTDYFDNVIGSSSKKETHVWANIEKGQLHRAFSVFLFQDGKLWLQQRAASKITFPSIWANTCCSHPLDTPSEQILEDAMGVKNAARRKLQHELGIPTEDVPLDAFNFITRVHYAGASTQDDAVGASASASSSTSSSSSSSPVWGEHEIDWILLCTPTKPVRMELNDNEVATVRAFSQSELRAWMDGREAGGYQVSPWFACMEGGGSGILYKWWNAVLEGRIPTVYERGVIHRQHEMAGGGGLPTAFEACLAATPVEARSAGVLPIKMPLEDALLRAGSTAAPSSAAASNSSSSSSSSASASLPSSNTATTSSSSSAAYATTSSATTTLGGKNSVSPRLSGAGASPPPPSSSSSSSAAVAKQGAYGKVKTHAEPLLSQLSHLDEVWIAVLFKAGLSAGSKVTPLPKDAPACLLFCEDILQKVSRSFAMVIQQLPEALRRAVCVFYLVLRGLDTVEDDMEAFRGEGRQAEKLLHLRRFHTYLYDPSFRMEGVGEGDEAALLQKFTLVHEAFMKHLSETERTVIADICARMGEGMASFAGRDLKEGTLEIKEYNLYCHYVAGLVGEGLSRLFVARGDEAAIVGRDMKIADDMGLFLQKTNIIRDYLEDLVEGRAFWPKEIWGLYSPRYDALATKALAPPGSKDREVALATLNHMIADALSLVPSCLIYLSRLRSKEIFRFCAIPQVMAIATLDKLANNIDVYTGVVKIRKGLALSLMDKCSDAEAVARIFLHHTRSIMAKIPPRHEAAYAIVSRAGAYIENDCLSRLPPPKWAGALYSFPALAIVAVLYAYCLQHLYQQSISGAWISSFLPRVTDSFDVLALAVAVGCSVYLIALAGVPLVQSVLPQLEQQQQQLQKGAATDAAQKLGGSEKTAASSSNGQQAISAL